MWDAGASSFHSAPLFQPCTYDWVWMPQRFSFQSPPAGQESSQSLPPEAVHTRLAGISKRVPVWERSFCWPTAPALLASEGLKLLEKSVYILPYTHTHKHSYSISFAVSPSSASDLEHHLFLISSSTCTQSCFQSLKKRKFWPFSTSCLS